MKLQYILLLAATALLSTIDASLATTSSTTSTLSSATAGHSLSTQQLNVVTKRLLRAKTTTEEDEDEEDDDDDEDRAFSLPASATKKLSSLTKSTFKSTNLESKFADRFFKVLQLDSKNSFIFGSKQLRDWAAYVLKLNKGNTEASMASMLTTLTSHYKSADVARWIHSAKVAPSVGNLAKQLQNAQFSKWYNAGQDAIGIRKLLRNGATKPWTAELAHRDEEIVQAFQTFAKRQQGIA